MDRETNEIIDGLTGDIQVGKRYYIFTVTYAYIAHVARVTDYAFHLDNVWIVSRAGSEVDAVTQVVHGKKKPEAYESLGVPMVVTRQSVTAAIPMVK
jgi:hypothetical protein